MLGRWTLDTSPVFIAFDLMSRVLSPCDLNPHGINPLTAILDASIDFDRLSRSPIKLFVTATNVHTGRGRVHTILVQINPRERPGTPRTAAEILNRLNEVSFNATLMKELRMIALLRQVANAGSGEGARWAGMRTHRIMSEMMTDLGYSSKLNGERAFLRMLRAEGRRGADAFLKEHAADLGRRSTADLDVLLAEC
jgi:NTE family protein